MTTNDELKQVYDAQYAAGYAAAHTPVDTWEESLLIHRLGGDWRGRTVLEIGCGEGRLAALLAMSGADVIAYDYSAEAIRRARWTYKRVGQVYFQCGDPVGVKGLNRLGRGCDVVVMQGVLEHLDDWKDYLSRIIMKRGSKAIIITSSPSFLNPRGYIWQALRLLLGVPMSLTDLHFICPPDMEQFAAEHDYKLTYESCHHDWAAGDTLLRDYAQRLPNALRDAGLPTDRVPELLAWLEQVKGFYEPQAWSGANVVYKLEKDNG